MSEFRAVRTAVIFLLAVFAVIPLAAQDKFRFAIIGDRTGGHTEEVFQEVLAEIAMLKPDFVITVGDQIEGYGSDMDEMAKEWDEFQGFIKASGVKYYPVPGNHDIWSDDAEKLYRERWGDPYYSFDYMNTHFIVLDTGRYEFPHEMDEEQIAWLENDLRNSKAENKTVFFHKPFWFNSVKSGTQDQVHDLFVKYGVDRVFNGHFHIYCIHELDGIDYTIVGSSGGGIGENKEPAGQFFQYLFVTVDGEEISTALLRHKSILPVDTITYEKLEHLDKIIDENLIAGLIPFKENGKKFKTNASISVVGYDDESVDVTVKWNMGESEWVIKGEGAEFTVNPGETVTNDFKAVLGKGKNLFPVPTFTVTFPIDGKPMTNESYLPIVRTANCVRMDTAPVLDGKLDEWNEKNAVKQMAGMYGDASEMKTEWYFSHDSENLYMAVKCEQESEVSAEATETDGGVYLDDNLWFFISPDTESSVYYQLMVNPLGTVFDRKCEFKNGSSEKDQSWNGNWKTAVTRENNNWNIEIAIPLKDFGKCSDKWGLNFRRFIKTEDNASVWNLPFEHNPKSFGLMVME